MIVLFLCWWNCKYRKKKCDMEERWQMFEQVYELLRENRIYYTGRENGFRQGMRGSFTGRQRKWVQLLIGGEMQNGVKFFGNSSIYIFFILFREIESKAICWQEVSIFSSVKWEASRQDWRRNNRRNCLANSSPLYSYR